MGVVGKAIAHDDQERSLAARHRLHRARHIAVALAIERVLLDEIRIRQVRHKQHGLLLTSLI